MLKNTIFSPKIISIIVILTVGSNFECLLGISTYIDLSADIDCRIKIQPFYTYKTEEDARNELHKIKSGTIVECRTGIYRRHFIIINERRVYGQWVKHESYPPQRFQIEDYPHRRGMVKIFWANFKTPLQKALTLRFLMEKIERMQKGTPNIFANGWLHPAFMYLALFSNANPELCKIILFVLSVIE